MSNLSQFFSPNVIDNEDLYGVITLGGQTSPGKVTLSGHDRVVKWDVHTGPAFSGATLTLHSIPPIEFTASFYLVKDVAQGIDDYAAWDKFRPTIDSTVSGITPKALPIYHPDLAENDVKAVCKATVGGRIYDGKGGCTINVKFQEYRAPKPKTGNPVTKTATDPNAALKANVTQLTAQYQATPWG